MKGIYILYKSTRIETGEYYIGVHSIDTDKFPDFNDRYLGSGHRITASVKKYGKKAFIRSILAIIESRKEAEALEAAMVTVEMISDPLCLNLAPGGRVGVAGVPKSAETRQAISDARKGVSTGPRSAETRRAISDGQRGIPKGPHSAETRQKMSDAQKGVSKSAEQCQAISDAKKGVSTGPKSAETRKKLSDAMKGVPSPLKGVPSPLKGVPKSAETRQKMSDARKEWCRQRKLKSLEFNNLIQ